MRRILTHILIAAALLFPVIAEASAALSAQDSIAGLGVTVTVQNLTGNATLAVLDPDGKSSQIPVTSDANGNATVNVPGRSTETAGTYTFTLTQNGANVGSITAAVLPDTMDPVASTVQAWTPSIQPNGTDAADITVTMRDKYGNILPGRPIALVSSRSQDVITQVTPETDKDGTQHFSLTTTLPGSIQIRAVDLLSGTALSQVAQLTAGTSKEAMGGEPVFYGQNTGSQPAEVADGKQFYAQVGQSFDVIQGFEVTVTPSSLTAGQQAQKVTVRAIDKNGNTVENYVGTVDFESTDPNATLPNFGSYTFLDRDLGEKIFPLVLSFQASGPQTLRVKDHNDPSIVGEATVTVSGGTMHGSAGIQITSHHDGETINTTNITIAGTGPAYANLIVIGGTQNVTGSTDAQGNFSIPVTLNPSQHDFTIDVHDDAGHNDSGPLHLILDQNAPKIGSITFAPEQPEPNQKVLVVVQADPGDTLLMKLQDPATNANQSIPLTAMPTSSGSYQAFFTAPSSGVYQPDIVATDAAGNATDVRAMLTVGATTLQKVMNVQAAPRVNAVELSWDAVSDTVDGYRVYVGDSPTNFLYTLDTGRPTTKATVAGLTPGKDYYFAVTAVKQNLESSDKSDVVKAQALGLTLTVIPGDGTLNVSWTPVANNLPLSAYLLEYGVQENTYTETRMLNGGLQDYMMHDLINGVAYFIRLTPITTTGDKLTDLAATGQGTPNGTGFHAGPHDDIPGNIASNPGGLKGTTGKLTGSGVPTTVWFAAAMIGLLGALYGWHKRQVSRHTAAFMAMMQKQYGR